MASLAKIILFTFVAVLVTLGYIQTGIADDVKAVPKYFGKWYTVGIIFEKDYTADVACKWYNVSTGEYGYQFYEMARMYVGPHREKHYHFDGIGSVVGSQVRMHFRAFELQDYYYNYTLFNNDQEVIMVDPTYIPFGELLSRTTTASPDAIKQFEATAANAASYVYYVHHNNCTYTP